MYNLLQVSCFIILSFLESPSFCKTFSHMNIEKDFTCMWSIINIWWYVSQAYFVECWYRFVIYFQSYRNCCVPECHTTGYGEIHGYGVPSYHCFPSINDPLRSVWLNKIKRDEGPYFKVCFLLITKVLSNLKSLLKLSNMLHTVTRLFFQLFVWREALVIGLDKVSAS